MANMARGKYGKDHPEHFIEGALTGGSGPSEGIKHIKVDRKGQSIKEAVALDNVGHLYTPRIETSIRDRAWRGSTKNLEHSLEGAHAPGDGDVGAAGHVRHLTGD